MVVLTRHEESIKARLCFAFQASWILFQSFHYNPLQAFNLFELLLFFYVFLFYAFIFFPFSHSFPLFSLRVVFPNLLQGGSLPNSMKTGWFSCFICQSFNFFVFLSFLRRASPAIFYFYLQTPWIQVRLLASFSLIRFFSVFFFFTCICICMLFLFRFFVFSMHVCYFF